MDDKPPSFDRDQPSIKQAILWKRLELHVELMSGALLDFREAGGILETAGLSGWSREQVLQAIRALGYIRETIDAELRRVKAERRD